MPRKYIRKTTRGGWSAESMENALDAVKNGMAFKRASREFSVPLMSLKRRAKEKNKIALGAVKYLGGRKTVFTDEQEAELVNHIKDMEMRMYGLTRSEILSLAFQLAERNNIPHPFKGEKAGNAWLKGFRERHPDITLRSPESTSTARASAFNKPVVEKNFSILSDVQNKKKFPPHRIFNVDETSICTVPTKNTKVFAATGRKQVARVTSAERGVTTTAVFCMSASGTFIPPMFIFRRIRMKIELMDGAPPGSIWACNSSGWMKLEVFTQWFDHFLHHTKPSEQDPVLLILDGHLSHTKNLEVILKARENHVTIVCLPPHCTHKLQPLDVSVMYPLSIFHNQSLEKWMNNNPGRAVTVFQVTKIFGEAYLKAAIPTNAIKGFMKTGIYPLDPDVFSEEDFIASKTTDNEMEIENLSQSEMVSESLVTEIPHPALTEYQMESEETTVPSQLECPSLSFNTQQISPSDCAQFDRESMQHKTPSPEINTKFPDRSPLSPLPSTSSVVNSSESVPGYFDVTPAQIKPLPKMVGKRSTLKRRSGHTTVLTSTPYKDYLQNEFNKTSGKENKKIRKNSKNRKTNTREKGLGKRMHSKRSFVESESSDEDDTECLFCTERFSSDTKGERWIKCVACGKWGHEACAGIDSDDSSEFICDICTTTPAKKQLKL